MKQKALIWDMDGTLIDSYEIIVSSLRTTLLEMGISMEETEIMKFVIIHSVNSFIEKIACENNKPSQDIKKRYSEITSMKTMEIRPISNAKKMLQGVCDNGVMNYIYTHRGKSTYEVLNNIGIRSFFKEIVTSESGFPRKPCPDAIDYLVEKHRLDKSNTFYIGDRSIDIECAINAGIRSILYLPEESYRKPTGKEDYVVKDLLEIIGIVKE